MATVNLLSLTFSDDRHTAAIQFEVIAEPNGIQQITLLDRTGRRVSGLRDASATVVVEPPCAPRITRTFTARVEFFPVQLEVRECASDHFQLSTSHPLPGWDQPPTFPDCRDELNRPAPGPQCVRAKQDADVARLHAREACGILTQLTNAQQMFRVEYEGHIMRWAAASAVAVGAAFIPVLGGLAAISASAVAIVFLVAALRASRQASSLNDRVADAQHALN